MFFSSKKENPEVTAIKNLNGGLVQIALTALERARLDIIYHALFSSNEILYKLAMQTQSARNRVRSKTDKQVIEFLTGNIDKICDLFSDKTEPDTKEFLKQFCLRASMGNFMLAELNNYPSIEIEYLDWCIDFDRFNTITEFAFYIKRIISAEKDVGIFFQNDNYSIKQIDRLKDFRLRLLVEAAVEIMIESGGGRFAGNGIDHGSFKVEPAPSFIHTEWHITLKKFKEYAIHRTMMSDEGKVLKETLRSDENFSSEQSLLLGSW